VLGVALRRWQLISTVQQRTENLMESGKGEFGVRLNTCT